MATVGVPLVNLAASQAVATAYATVGSALAYSPTDGLIINTGSVVAAASGTLGASAVASATAVSAASASPSMNATTTQKMEQMSLDGKWQKATPRGFSVCLASHHPVSHVKHVN